ncbi:MAG: hypothetical protein Q7S51_09385 [Gallionellaceae bacterium]|nr:hypothetical protein [Gallionellaceae bacterium]
MAHKALVIQDSQNQSFDCNAFMSERNLVPEYCSTGVRALSSFKTKRYRCVVVSMDIQNEDPLAIIRELRSAEIALGLSTTQILVVYKKRQPTQPEITKFNIGGQIRLHRML